MINKMQLKAVFVVLFLTILFAGCKEEVTPIINAVAFEISQPSEDAVYNYGDTVFIESDITWENELHGYEVFIKQLDNDSIVFNSHAHNDSHQMKIYKIWVNKVKASCEMQLILKAYTSHEEQWETKTLNFVCLPMK